MWTQEVANGIYFIFIVCMSCKDVFVLSVCSFWNPGMKCNHSKRVVLLKLVISRCWYQHQISLQSKDIRKSHSRGNQLVRVFPWGVSPFVTLVKILDVIIFLQTYEAHCWSLPLSDCKRPSKTQQSANGSRGCNEADSVVKSSKLSASAPEFVPSGMAAYEVKRGFPPLPHWHVVILWRSWNWESAVILTGVSVLVCLVSF